MPGSEIHLIGDKVYVHIGHPWNEGHWIDRSHHVEVTVDAKQGSRIKAYLLKIFRKGANLEAK